jgi:putative CocE/NonD family hydrolase
MFKNQLLTLSFFLIVIHVLNAQTDGYAFAYEPSYELRTSKFKYQSFYVETDDGELLATDLLLPKDYKEGEKLPTVLYLTRYIRLIEGRWFIKWLKNPLFGQVAENEAKFWIEHGYAVVLTDVRGTGASTGVREMEFSPREIKDGALIVDWIIEQAWSNGKVGSAGISYLGTTAELLLVNQHPAVKACIPRSNIVDLYDHITYPGGIPHSAFIKVWRDLTLSLDTGYLGIAGKQAQTFAKGAMPVMGDKNRAIFKRAQNDHKQNFDIFKALNEVDFVDEVHPDLEKPITSYSISNYINEVANSGTAIYRIDGWWDGALVKSAIYGYLATPNTHRLLIGPWDHGPAENVSPFAESNEVTFPIKKDMLRFFDEHLKGIETGIGSEPPIHYYTMGQEVWKTSEVWPPANSAYDTLFLSLDGNLTNDITQKVAGSKTYGVDYSLGTGGAAGWNSMTGTYRFDGPISYSNRDEVNARMEVFTSEPLTSPLEITGHPIVDIYMSVPTTDGTLFAYLEEVSPDGFVQYITEGQLRLIHRKISDETPNLPLIGPYHSYKKADAMLVPPNEPIKVSFEMIPTSYEVPAGHQLRISLAGTDIDHFSLPAIKPNEMTFYFENELESKIYLPIVR